MDRLTERTITGEVTRKCDHYNCKYFTGIDCKAECEKDILAKLADYEDLEDQGLLVKLPCKVGDIIWDNDFGFSESYVVTGFSLGILSDEDDNELESSNEILVYFRDNFGTTGRFPVSEIGKTVFLTMEEAMKSVKGD